MGNLFALYTLSKSYIYFFIAAIFLVSFCVDANISPGVGYSPIPEVYFTFVEEGQVVVTIQPIDIQGINVESGWAIRDGELVGPVITPPPLTAAIDISYHPEDHNATSVSIDDDLYIFYPAGDIVRL